MYINLENQKVKVSDVVSNFIPDFILDENPLFLEFLKSYFYSREAFGSDLDLIRNILDYKNIKKLFFLKESTTLSSSIDDIDTVITVESTEDFPDKFGLLQIDDEIIGYEYKTDTQFINCFRGFSGATELGRYDFNNEYVFTKTNAISHDNSSNVKNLGILFLQQFLFELKAKYLPGFENVKFFEGINPNLILPRIKDFYSSKGNLNSFKILFKLLFGEEIEVSLPKDNILKSSDSNFIEVFNVIVELQSGDIEKIKGSTVFQDENIDRNIKKSEGVVYDVNFLKSVNLPEIEFEADSSSQVGNIITIVSADHGLSTGDSVFLQFPENGSPTQVYREVLVVNSNTFQVYSSEVKNVTSQTAQISTLLNKKSTFYKLKLSSIDGEFSISGKTKLVQTITTSDTDIFVDSTLGFPDSGSISIEGDIITYGSKSSSAFKECSNIDTNHLLGSDVTLNQVIYSYEDGNTSNRVTMRLVDISSNELDNSDILVKKDIKMPLKSIGFSESNTFIDSWILNKPIDIEVSSIDLVNNSINFDVDHNLLNDDVIDVKDLNVFNKNGVRNKKYIESTKITVSDSKKIILAELINPDLINKNLVVSKVLEFGSSETIPNIDSEISNVQRVLTDVNNKSYYVLTSSIPDYSVNLNSTNNSIDRIYTNVGFAGSETVNFDNIHNLKTGEKIRFTLVGSSSSISNSYYVKKESSTGIKLGLSRSSVDSEDFINLTELRTSVGTASTSITIIKDEFYGKKVKDQELIRYFNNKNNNFSLESETYDFENKPVIPFGTLIDGVDLYPPFDKDEINYGRVENIEVLNPGEDFDLINPPSAYFDNTTGIGASVKLGLIGELKELAITNKGSNIRGDININITGGANKNVKLSPVIIESFPTKVFSAENAVNLLDNTITFTTSHSFLTGDRIRYGVSAGSTAPGRSGGKKLIDNSEYFIIKESDTVIKLADTKEEAISGTAIDLSDTLGFRDNTITSVDANRILERINIDDPGSFKVNETNFGESIRRYPPEQSYEYLHKGINLENNYFYYKNHGFDDGDLVIYESTSTPISGLVDNNYYHIAKISDDKFKLAYAGSDINSVSTSNFDKNLHVNLKSIPQTVGHKFKIPPVTITISEQFSVVTPEITPIIKGSIKNVVIDSNGSDYGSEIVNFSKKPILRITKGEDAFIKLLVRNGRIESVFVVNQGTGYDSLPELIINPGESNGRFGRLLPIISNGKLTDVKIINSGINYDDTTSVTVLNSGKNSRFDVSIQKWRVNSIYKNILDSTNSFTENENYLVPGTGDSLQIVSSYAPKDLRKKLGDTENRKQSDIESLTFKHSPIVGWAIDGNPIYSQFGYSIANQPTSEPRRIKSSYLQIPQSVLETSSNRPSIVDYPIGYFIEDYYFDESIGDLDENNGRYCYTPEFPEGTYAYFSTLGDDGSPSFPYCVYNLKDKLISNNIDFTKSKQSYLKNIENNLITCTGKYLITDNQYTYSFLDELQKNNLIFVENTKTSFVDKINVLESGKNYKIDDKVTITNNETFGSDAKGIVSLINGVGISTITSTKTTKTNVSFEINSNFVRSILEEPHEFSNRDLIRVIISGITTSNFLFLNKTYPVTVPTQSTNLLKSLNSAGIVTYAQISDAGRSLNLNIDDQLKINNEKFRVLSFDSQTNQVKLERAVSGTSLESHAQSTEIKILPSTFEFKTGIQTNLSTSNYNKIYFNRNDVGIGTTSTPTTINYGVNGTEIKIPKKQIYAPNHKFNNNDYVTYNFADGGTGLDVSESIDLNESAELSDGENFYIIKYDNNYIGLNTVPIKKGSSDNQGVYFASSSDEELHSLTYNPLPKGSVTEIETVINTSDPHGLQVNDIINLKINPGFTTETDLNYDTDLNILHLDQISFTSGISSGNNTITFSNHGLNTGDRVIYNSTTPLGSDFTDSNIYYVTAYSNDVLSLSSTFDDVLENNFLNITETSGTHELRKIYPDIFVVSGSTLKLTGINRIPGKLRFYEEKVFIPENTFDMNNFVQTYNNNELIELSIDSKLIPSKLYGVIIQDGHIPSDDQVALTINKFDSIYDRQYAITGIPSTTQFNIELEEDPEVLTYNSTNSKPVYTTTSKTGIGSINSISVVDSGLGFTFPTGIASVSSTTGSDAILSYDLKSDSESITKFRDINNFYNFSADKTYKFNLDIPSIVSVKSNNILTSIDVIDSGKNYILPPKVSVLNEPNIISSAIIDGNSISSVNLITKDIGILSDNVTVFSEFHTNGVEVTSVVLQNDNTTVDLFIKEPNNGFTSFPFEIGDEIYVDGIGITTDSGDGYNSKDYDFRYFKITSINDVSGSTRVRYSLEGLTVNPGTFDSNISYGRVIKKDDFVKFSATLNSSNYFSGEIVRSDSDYTATIIEDGWNSDAKTLSLINQKGNLTPGDILTGSISGAKSIVTKVTNFNSILKTKSFSDGFEKLDNKSELNSSSQVLADNFYYQSFAYEIKSKVSYDKWNPFVGSLNHISGYEKFSNFFVEQETSVGGNSQDSDTTSSIIIESDIKSFDEIENFDLVTENIIDVGDFNISNEITFKSKQLTDSIFSLTNSSFIIDDISDQFTGRHDLDDGSKIVGLSSFRLTTSRSGITTALFVKTIDSSSSNVSISDDTLIINNHGFSTGEELDVTGVSGDDRIGIAATTYVIGGISTEFLPSKVFAIKVDSNTIRLAGFNTTANSNNYFDITSLGNGELKLATTNSNSRTLITIDNLVQTPLTDRTTNHTLSNNLDVGSTTASLSGITSIGVDTLLLLDDEIVKVELVDDVSNIITIKRAQMGTIESSHISGIGITIKSGQYSIIEDVIYFSEPPFGSTDNFDITGISSSLIRSSFTGRTFNKKSYDTNIVFDDISDEFDGSTSIFKLKSNNSLVDLSDPESEGLLVGSDVSSGFIMVNNILQIPGVDYNIIANGIGIGASIEFLGTQNLETLPKGGIINVFDIDYGSGYQEQSTASAEITPSDLSSGEIVSITLKERGSGYRTNTPIYVNTPGVGATITALVGLGTYDGNSNLTISTFDYTHTTGIATVTTSGAHGLVTSQIPDVIIGGGIISDIHGDSVAEQFTVLNIISNNTIEVGIGTSSSSYSYTTGGTLSPGINVGFITGFEIEGGGSGYAVTSIIKIPSPTPYGNISLTGGNGTDATVDISVAGAAGSVFNASLINKGIAYKPDDILSITGIPTSPYHKNHSNFQLTVKSVDKDDFSAFSFGEFILFDDVSSQVNGFRKTFFLTRSVTGTKALVSLSNPSDLPENLTGSLNVNLSDNVIQNNLVILVNDVVQTPGVNYTFVGGTRFTFAEAPSLGSKVTILFFKGSESDILSIDILETVKSGDSLILQESLSKNLQDEKDRATFSILSADVVQTAVYSDIGLGVDDELERPINWKKQNKDLIIDGDIVPKTRIELNSQIIPSTNLIKPFTSTETDLFVSNSNIFDIDNLSEENNNIVIIDNSFADYFAASAEITLSKTTVNSVSIANSGSGYSSIPEVKVFSSVEQEKLSGAKWSNNEFSVLQVFNGLNTISDNVESTSTDVLISTGSTMAISVGATFTTIDDTGDSVSDIIYVNTDDIYVAVTTSGAIATNSSVTGQYIASSETDSFEFINSLNQSSYGDNQTLITLCGDGFVGFSSSPYGFWTKITSATPVITGVSGGSGLAGIAKVSLSNFNFNKVVYFEELGRAIAVGSTIVATTNSSNDLGSDWSFLNIDSDQGGPRGQNLNGIVFYPRNDEVSDGAPSSKGYFIVGDNNYIFKSHVGNRWTTNQTGGLSFTISPPSEATGLNFNDIAVDGSNSIVAVGQSGLIIRATTAKTSSDVWSYVGIDTTDDFKEIVYSTNSYVAITTSGKSYTSVDGISWVLRDVDSLYDEGISIGSLVFDSSKNQVIAVGSLNSEPIIGVSTAIILDASISATIDTDGFVNSLTIDNVGFGYSSNNPPEILIESPVGKITNINSLKYEGDFGDIVAISTSVGINTDLAMKFEFKIDPILNSSLYTNFTLSKSGIETGYYFAVTNSVYAPTSEVFASVDAGLSTITKSSDFNKIYRCSHYVDNTTTGIVTVTADITEPDSGFSILNNSLSGITTSNYGYVAKYSWGRLFDFTRSVSDTNDFTTKTGLGTSYNNTGLSSNPIVMRTSRIITNY